MLTVIAIAVVLGIAAANVAVKRNVDHDTATVYLLLQGYYYYCPNSW